MNIKRRDFLTALASTAVVVAHRPSAAAASAASVAEPSVGKPWTGWQKGHFQLHAIYTGAAESMFLIYPDGTTMLIDCGGHAAINRGRLAVPVLPGGNRLAGEWVARYIERVNPARRDVDYLVVSHFHSDHTGCGSFHAGRTSGREEDYFLSGIAQVAETIRFKKAVDRGWPNYDDPIPLAQTKEGDPLVNMRRLYRHLSRRDGLAVEKFRLGAADQFAPLKDPSLCGGFRVRNLCGNGKVLQRDGSVRDLYAERLARQHPKKLNENGMSLGMMFEYGGFRFFTAGDFSDKWKLPDGTLADIEAELAGALPCVDVAKIMHHGHHSMSAPLVAALRPRVWFSCVWDQLHNTADTLERLTDRSVYPGDRLIAPGIFPAERRLEDADKAFLADIAPESFKGGHVVLDVEPGGAAYSLSYLTADDESMKVNGVYRFTKRVP